MARRKIIVIGILCVILSTFGYFLIRNKNSFEKSLTDFECKGIIENIEQRKNHGIYYFFINGGWQYFGTYGDYVNHFAVVGDSLVKEKGKSAQNI